MTDVEAAWLAGLFDGEGNIMLTRAGKPLSVRMSIANCCLPLLDRVIVVTGTGKLNSKGPPQKANHTQGYTWACYSTNAHAVLKRILPWLIVKREEALAVLS